MKRVVVCLCAVLAVGAARVEAQPVPDRGMVAVGAEFGAFVPDEEFDGSWLVSGAVEYYFTPRASLRTSLSYTNPEFERGTDDELRQVRLGFDGIYNWERGKWHPFLGAGLGVHFLKLRENDREIDSDTELGFALLGGVEYFLSREAAIKGELRYQPVGNWGPLEPSGLALTAGIKWYIR